MKPTLLLLLSILTISPLWGQDVISKMSAGTCECLKKRDLGSKSADAVQIELGLCLIEQAGLHEKGLKKAGYDTKSTGIYERLGEKVGVNLALNCPEFMAVLGTMLKDEESGFKDKVRERMSNTATPPPVQTATFVGEVKAIEYGDFVKIVLKDVDGKRRDFYWINSFEGDDALMALDTLDSLVGKNLEIGYYEEDVYFYKLKSYLGINCISGVKVQ